MNFVIPMAGRGQRFIDAGYKMPKMLIEAHGKTLLQWSIDSLPIELCSNLVCIILQEHEDEFGISKIVKDIYGKHTPLSFHFLNGVTRGQAETVYMAKEHFNNATDLLIFNIDTCFRSNSLAGKLQRPDVDGVLGAFHSTEGRFSYAKTNDTGVVVHTAEKDVISDMALTGLYHFKKVSDFLETATYHFENDIRVNNEFYVAPMYNYLIAQGKQYILDAVSAHFILGTPAELDSFIDKEVHTLL